MLNQTETQWSNRMQIAQWASNLSNSSFSDRSRWQHLGILL